jgi:immune inhibitor A
MVAMRIFWVFVLLVMTLNGWELSAQTPMAIGEAFPTYQALMQTTVPIADRVDIARRLGKPILALQNPLQQPSLGDREAFFVLNASENTSSTITAELVAMGEHAYVWIEQPVLVTSAEAQSFVSRFDSEIYPIVRDLWGSEATPGIDGDPRIYLLFTRFIASSVAGYFTSQHTYPATIVPNSNEHEMLIFNLNIFEQEWNETWLLRFSAHEFQHMIRHSVDENESSWIDEGFSVFTEGYLGFEDSRDFAARFLSNPRIQLNDWQGRIENYGGSFLWMQYFYERFGISGLQTLSNELTDGFMGVANALKTLQQEDANVLFADWVVANGINMPQTGYGYSAWWDDVIRTAQPLATVSGYPHLTENRAVQYSADYYQLQNWGEASQLQVTLTHNTSVNLLPFGEIGHHLYGNMGDESDTTATAQFDLTNLTNATLQYRVWHDLETYWDYAYVMVSTDGETWQIVPSQRTTSENPNSKSYGVGYTGNSGGWQDDQVDLTPFVGQQIWLRFEMITDDATTRPGIAIDDVHIAQLGYAENFENGTGLWSLDGWIRSDNRLPQQVWLQVVQVAGETATVTRYLSHQDNPHNIEIIPNAEKIWVMVSPFAPLTTVDMPYTLQIEIDN